MKLHSKVARWINRGVFFFSWPDICHFSSETMTLISWPVALLCPYSSFFDCVGVVRPAMDNDDIKKVRQVLRRHEDINQANGNAQMIISYKITGFEQASATNNANIMSFLLRQKQ